MLAIEYERDQETRNLERVCAFLLSLLTTSQQCVPLLTVFCAVMW